MFKQIILHDAFTGKEIVVNAETIKTPGKVEVSEWISCYCDLENVTNSRPLDKKEIDSRHKTLIKWIDETCKEHEAIVSESFFTICKMFKP